MLWFFRITDLTIFNGGSWVVFKSSTSTVSNDSFGSSGNVPAIGGYYGDGKTDFDVYRPKTGVWHVSKSSDGSYQPNTLGISTDKLVESAYLKQNGSVAFDNTFARTRLSPKNAGGGTNLYSQNFGWRSGLVGLPGRNSLDAGFGIGYNSLVWIKHNNTMVFDPDYSYKVQTGSSTVANNGLVSEVKLYDGGNNALLKRSTTAYNENGAYLSRRIIGLPLETNSYGLNQKTGNEQHISRVTYAYDEGDFSDTALQQTIAHVQHDGTNYGSSFVVGRGNLTSATRHDVSSQSAAISSSIKYNTAGLPVASIDLLGRTSKIQYTDSFNDNNNSRNTYAYPTKLIDAAGNFSEVKYRFDVGANV